MILEDKQEIRRQFYYDWALILDSRNVRLLEYVHNLNSILFALNIDNADLEVYNLLNSDMDSSEDSKKLAPVKKTTNSVFLKTNKKSNMVVINDNDCENDVNEDIYARSAPATSFLTSKFTTNSLHEKSEELSIKSNLLDNTSTSSFSINDNSNLTLYPVYCEDKESVKSDKTILSIDYLKERINTLEYEKDKLIKENNLLNIQLKKYIAAIELLKYNKKDGNVIKEEDKNSANAYSYNDLKDYEKKLVQVSEMHGELVEFNEHLYKVIQLKDSVISRLRDELVELRGPVSIGLKGNNFHSTLFVCFSVARK